MQQNTDHPLWVRLLSHNQSRNDQRSRNAWTDEESYWPSGCHPTVMRGILERNVICRGGGEQTDLAGGEHPLSFCYWELETHRISKHNIKWFHYSGFDLISQSKMEEKLGMGI